MTKTYGLSDLDHSVHEVHPLPFKPGRFANTPPCEKQQNKKRLPEIIQHFEKTPNLIKSKGSGRLTFRFPDRVHISERIGADDAMLFSKLHDHPGRGQDVLLGFASDFQLAETWLKNFSNDTDFWVDHDIGRRVCVLLEKIRSLEPALFDKDKAIRSDVDRLLPALINLGVPEAKRLEEALATEPGSGP